MVRVVPALLLVIATALCIAADSGSSLSTNWVPLDGADPISLATLPVACVDSNGNTLGIATGWVMTSDVGTFLITNFHVIKGGASLRIFHRPAQGYKLVPIDEPLYRADGRRRWAQHKRLGTKVDVVAIPLREHPDVKIHALNLGEFHDDLMVRPATMLSIVGYPKGQMAQTTPFWKAGHLASDPAYYPKPNDIDILYVDATTTPGMSGSPVLVRVNGPYVRSGGGLVADGKPVHTRMLGIFSAVLGEKTPEGIKDLGTHIGIIWPLNVLAELEYYH